MSAGTIIGVAFGVVFILVVGALYTYLEFEKERNSDQKLKCIIDIMNVITRTVTPI